MQNLINFLPQMKKLSQKNKQLFETAILLSAGILIILLWNTWLIYPVKIFVVLLHEMSHGISAVLTGGSIKSIEFNSYLGGQCSTLGGNEMIVASTGYTGSLVLGSLLYIFSYDKQKSIIVCTTYAVIILLFTTSFITGSFAVIFALITSVILYVSPRFFNSIFHSYFIRFVGFSSVLYVLVDIKEDILTKDLRMTDAHILAEITGISHLFWGLLWFVITIVVIYFLLRYGYKKGLTIK